MKTKKGACGLGFDPAYLKPRPVVVRDSTEVILSKEIVKNLN